MPNQPNNLIVVLPGPFRRLLGRAESSTLGRRLLHGLSWAMAGEIGAMFFPLVSSVLVARTLGRETFGELGIIQSTVGMFQVFAGFSLGLTANKHVAEYYRSDPVRAGQIIAMSGIFALLTGGLVALLFLFAAPWLASNTIAAPHLTNLLRIGGILLFLGALNGAQSGALSGFEAFRVQTLLTVLNGFISPLLLVAGVLSGGLYGVVWAMVMVSVCNWAATHLMLRRVMANAGVPFCFAGAMRNLKVLRTFSLPAVMGGLLVTPVDWACNALLVNQPDGYAQMGIYNVAMKWFNMVMLVPRVVGNVVTPILSERFGANDNRSIAKVLSVCMKANGAVAIVVVTVGGLCSHLIMRIYGAEYENGWPTLIIILLTAGLLAILAPVGQVIAASGKMWTGFSMNLAWGLIFLALSYLMVTHGAFGLASAKLMAYGFHAIWTFWFAYSVIMEKKNGRIE